MRQEKKKKTQRPTKKKRQEKKRKKREKKETRPTEAHGSSALGVKQLEGCLVEGIKDSPKDTKTH